LIVSAFLRLQDTGKSYQNWTIANEPGKVMKKTLMLLAAVAVSSCSMPRENMNQIRVGMNRAEVQGILGPPDSSSADKGKECMYYSMWRDVWNRRPGDYSDRYYVCFEEGKVASYGKVGDEIRVKIDKS
jgi:hypothetical protein